MTTSTPSDPRQTPCRQTASRSAPSRPTRSGLAVCAVLLAAGALLAAPVFSQADTELWVGEEGRVTVVPNAGIVADVQVVIPTGCFGAGLLLSLADIPGNLKAPLDGDVAIGGPSNFGCSPDQLTTFDRFNFDRSTGQFFADVYCMPPLGPRGACIPEFVEGQLERVDCAPDGNTLCLNEGRFRVDVEFTDFDGNPGLGGVLPFPNDDSGVFFFFDPNNAEMLVKVLDACGFNDRFWVFYAATTNVEFSLQVTDTETGESKTYDNALGNSAEPVLDTAAFANCP